MCEGSLGFGEGVLSVFCSRACGAEHLLETDGPTGWQTAAGQSLGLELVRDREKKKKKMYSLEIL